MIWIKKCLEQVYNLFEKGFVTGMNQFKHIFWDFFSLVPTKILI